MGHDLIELSPPGGVRKGRSKQRVRKGRSKQQNNIKIAVDHIE